MCLSPWNVIAVKSRIPLEALIEKAVAEIVFGSYNSSWTFDLPVVLKFTNQFLGAVLNVLVAIAPY